MFKVPHHLLAVCVLAAPAFAEEPLQTPTGEVLLTVTGAIEKTNTDGAALFDLQMLEGMPSTEFETETIWTMGGQVFMGVELGDLLSALGVEEGTLTATAINDYSVEIPVSDAVEGGPIVAYSLNGAPMSVRDKGPLWVVYPYDSDEDYQSEVIYSRSIWQLDRIVVED
ncbi:molybdopterin-dependent oxidoreductase [Pontivivens ytuae]|uniref:Molybdopterin-dependent oxidoreductase n=1 Tax=Pontivivens ytuae TaxID=2789856 RepID=A0A7S9LV31_9RHOB|nr:molybdopterin-dependent oxidoreductase [Pontivivens ytuae]QPH55275.1 molybdopterin-dependent oxidoreductase [Pontivivens ytuae]